VKRRIVHKLEKYVFNLPVKFLFALGREAPGYALLETTGRKTRREGHTPLGNGQVRKQFWLIAEHGSKGGYVRNIEQNPRVRINLRDGFGAPWQTGTGYVLPDGDPRESALAGRSTATQCEEWTRVRLFGKSFSRFGLIWGPRLVQ
jgi:deazaflavin-dependent oxidoreductase (nitroreductase family)